MPVALFASFSPDMRVSKQQDKREIEMWMDHIPFIRPAEFMHSYSRLWGERVDLLVHFVGQQKRGPAEANLQGQDAESVVYSECCGLTKAYCRLYPCPFLFVFAARRPPFFPYHLKPTQPQEYAGTFLYLVSLGARLAGRFSV